MTELDSLRKERAELLRIVKEASRSRNARFTLFLGATGLVVLLTAFILTLIGVVDLRIVSNLAIPAWVDFVGSFALFMLNMYFVFSITLKTHVKNLLFFLMGFAFLWVIAPVFIEADQGLIFSYVLPLLTCLTFLYFQKQWNLWSFARIGLVFIGVPVYQVISGMVKVLCFKLAYNELNLITVLLMSVDLFFVYLFIYKVVRQYELVVAKKFCVLSKRNWVFQSRHSYRPAEKEKLILLLKMAIRWLYFAFQLAVVLLIGKLNSAFWELLVMLPVFWLGRVVLGKCWHSDKLWLCSCVTFSGFYSLTKCTLPFNISLFCCIILSGAFTYTMFKLGEMQESLDHYAQLTAFSLKSCTEAELREQCRLRKMRQEDTEKAVQAFVQNMSGKDLAIAWGMEYQSARNKKRELTKVLETAL